MVDLIGTTSSINFTRPTTFGKKHHSPPYSILCDYSRPIHKKNPHLGYWVAIHNKKKLAPLELHFGNLQQDQRKLDRSRPSKSWRNPHATFILQHILGTWWVPHWGQLWRFMRICYSHLPKLGTSRIQSSKHGKPSKTCIPKTNQGCLMLGKES